MRYSEQAKRDFEMWSILERAGMLPPPHRLPSRRLVKKAIARLNAMAATGASAPSAARVCEAPPTRTCAALPALPNQPSAVRTAAAL